MKNSVLDSLLLIEMEDLYAANNCDSADHHVAVRVGKQLYSGGICPHPSCHCRYHDLGAGYSGAEIISARNYERIQTSVSVRVSCLE